MNVGVIFAGGGLKGEWQANQWALNPYSPPAPRFLAGESIGACMALTVAVRGAVEARAIFSKIGPEDIFKGGNRWHQLLTLLGKRRGIWDMSPSYNTLRTIVGQRRIPEGVQVLVARVHLEHGCYLVETLTSDTPPAAAIDIVMDSCLVPVAHGARDGVWADGGIGGTAPLGPVAVAGADHLVVYLTDPAGIERWEPTGKALDEASRAIDIMRDRLWLADLENISLRNELAATGWSGRWRQITAQIYEPTASLGDWMSASRENKLLRQRTDARVYGLEEMLTTARARRATAETAARLQPAA